MSSLIDLSSVVVSSKPDDALDILSLYIGFMMGKLSLLLSMVKTKDLHFKMEVGRSSGSVQDLVQCYSVTTGKVSTIARAPSFSSLSSIEVAEINHLVNSAATGHDFIEEECVVKESVVKNLNFNYNNNINPCKHSFIR